MKNKQLIRKAFVYGALLIAGALVVGTFLTATSYAQLAVAILLYPLLVFFAFNTFPRKRRVSSKKQSFTQTMQPAEIVKEVKREALGISDIDKRVFLKLIGGAGLTLFLFSIFNKKAEGMFFKNAAGSVSGMVALEDGTGKKIDPARNQPTDGFSIAEVDDSAIAFYGFTDKDGAWFIMREDTDAGSFRYAKGDNNFPAIWKDRKNLKFDYFNDVFKTLS